MVRKRCILINNAALNQSIEIVRKRIDDLGTKEPSILQRLKIAKKTNIVKYNGNSICSCCQKVTILAPFWVPFWEPKRRKSGSGSGPKKGRFSVPDFSGKNGAKGRSD